MNQSTSPPIDLIYPTLANNPTSRHPVPTPAIHDVVHLSDAELLAALLHGPGGPEAEALALRQMLATYHGLIGLSRTPPTDWGLDSLATERLMAALELGRRLVWAEVRERPSIECPGHLAKQLLLEMRPLEQEVFKCVLLTTRLHLIKIVDVHQGTLNSTVIRPGDVFREPVRLGAAAIIVAHNHPSGDPTISPEDISTTRALIAAGNLLDIRVLDHLIIGDSWVSMRAQSTCWPPEPPGGNTYLC